MRFKSEEEKQRENKEFEKCLEDPEFRKHLEEELDRICEADIADAKADEKREQDGEAMLAQDEYYPIDFDDMEVI